jgi:8-oxo-dGTP pyrophosphatase MutT (NUDIX family)
MKNNWTLKNVQLEYENPVLRIERRDFLFNKNNSVGNFTVVSMRDWGVVVPITSDGEMLLVRQFRVATGEVTYEFPGGALETGEDPLSGSKRELQEETGFSGNMTFMSKMRPNPAFMDNFCYLYLAENCEKVSNLKLDPFEDLEPVFFSVEKVAEMIRNGDIVHSITLAAFGAYCSFKK